MNFFYKIKNQKGGFTLVEVIAVLVIIAIVASIAGVSIYAYTVNAKMNALNNKAKTIFMEAQDVLLDVKADNKMNEYSILAVPLLSVPSIDESWPYAPHDWSDEAVRGNIVYFLMEKVDELSEEDMKHPIRTIISASSLESEVNATVIIEFNKASGLVSSVLYSEQASSFDYSLNDSKSSKGTVSVYNRSASRLKDLRVGFYGSADTGAGSQSVESFPTFIVNDEKLSIYWVASSTENLDYTNFVYNITIYDEKKKVKYHSFEGISPGNPGQVEFDYPSEEMLLRESDLDPVKKLGCLVLDELPMDENSVSIFDNTQIPVGKFLVEVECKPAFVNVAAVQRSVSNISHTYFADEATEGDSLIYHIANARHMNNIRYGDDNYSYLQINNVDMLAGTWFAPIKAFKTRDLGLFVEDSGDKNEFAGVYDGGGFVLENLAIKSEADNTAIFDTLAEAGHLTRLGVINSMSEATLTTAQNAAIFTGVNNGLIEQCYTSSCMIGGYYAGSIAAINNGKIENVYSNALHEDLNMQAVPLITRRDADMEFGAIAAINKGEINRVYSSLFLVGGIEPEVKTQGLVGKNEGAGTLIDSYIVSYGGYNQFVTQGIHKTYEEMKGPVSGFTGFDDKIWELDPSKSTPEGYPFISLINVPHKMYWTVDYSFKIKGRIHFDDVAAEFDPNFEGYVKVNLYDSEAANYIGKMRFDAEYASIRPFYLRVKLDFFIVNIKTNRYEQIDTGIFKLSTPYNIDANNNEDKNEWYDNYQTDSFYYYASQLYGSDLNEFTVLPMVLGMSNDYDPGLHANQIAYVRYDIQGVQITRYPQFWKINQLPWRRS